MRNPRLARLFERFRTRGSTAALALVFDATAPALLRVARRITGDAGAAEDAVQSTFLAAIERAATWDARRPLEPWLFGILVRQLGAMRRQAARVVDAARLAAAPPEDPATAAERSELVAAVDAALQELPERDREVLRPWLADEARGVELAARLGVGGSTLRMRLQRGLARLRRALPVGFGAGIVLTVAERQALASVRGRVVAAAAARSGVAIAAGASITAKLAVAALLVAAAIGGAQLVRRGHAAPQEAAESRRPAGAMVVRAPAAVAPERHAEATAPQATPSAPAATIGSGPIESDIVTVPLVQGSASRDGVDGTVVTEMKVPIAGARVRLFDDERESCAAIAETTSAADGAFHVSLKGASLFHVVAERSGAGRAVEIGSRSNPPLVVIDSRATASGTITRDDGAPVPDAQVELADDAARFVGPIATTCDATGRYAIGPFARKIHWIRARSRDGALVGFSARSSGARDGAAAADLVLHPAARLVVTIRAEEDGRAVESALVVVRAGPDSTRSADAELRTASPLEALAPFGAVARSDAAGRVEIDAIPATAPLRIAVAARGFAPASCEVAGLRPGEARPLTLALGRGCVVTGVARELDGTPLAGARVAPEMAGPLAPFEELCAIAIDGDAPNPYALATVTGADGTFRLEELPPLTHHLLRLEARRKMAFAALSLARAGDTQSGVVFTLGRKVRIAGTIVAEDGAAPAATQIWIAPASELAKPDADGRFELELVPKLGATVWAAAPGYVHAQAEVEAPLAEVNRIAITLQRGLSIEGRVVDADQKPIANATLIAWPAYPTAEEQAKSGGWITEMNLAAAASGEDGAFTLRGLPERGVRLVVKAPGCDDVVVEPLTPGARDVTVTMKRTR